MTITPEFPNDFDRKPPYMVALNEFSFNPDFLLNTIFFIVATIQYNLSSYLYFYKNMVMKTGRSIVSLSFLRSLVYIKYLLLIYSEYFLQNSSNDLCV